jgi:hypothetical protein
MRMRLLSADPDQDTDFMPEALHVSTVIDRADEERVCLRAVGSAIPFGTSTHAWTEVNGVPARERRVRVLASGRRSL